MNKNIKHNLKKILNITNITQKHPEKIQTKTKRAHLGSRKSLHLSGFHLYFTKPLL